MYKMMRHLSTSACAAFTLLTGTAHAETAAIVRTPDGELQGVSSAATQHFYAVPYAAPPLGDLRWQAPQEVSPWRGTRQAMHSAPACAQSMSDVPSDSQISEDCLYLNVVVPSAKSRSLRPVMVWFHGGGFSGGTGSEVDPSALASENDVIVVTIDYRLGVFGLFGYPELSGSGTFILQDQRAALRWVQRSIRAFGGDPHNVTLFGQSGGAIAICGLLTSPASAGLFDRAILQSGACDTSAPRNGAMLGSPAVSWWKPASEVERAGRSLAAALGCGESATPDPVACLRGKSLAELQAHAGDFVAAAYHTPVLPEHPAQALRAGHFQRVPVMSGHTEDEWRLVLAIATLLGQTITAEQYPLLLQDSFGSAASTIEQTYPLSAFSDPGSAFARIMTDRMFVCPQLATNRSLAKHVPTYGYEFADPDAHPYLAPALPAGFTVGAAHASELAYLFDVPSVPAPSSSQQQQLARDMRAYWAAFARYGRPLGADGRVWPRDQFDVLLAPGSDGVSLVDTQREHHCNLWRDRANWTQYGNDLANSETTAKETTLDADDVTKLREQWRLRIPGGATGTPVISNGKAYFGAWNGHFYAVDAVSGEIQWDRRLTSFMIRSTALVNDDRVYVGAGASLVALDRKTGDTIFETKIDTHPDTGIDASPKLIDGLILVGDAHYENTIPDKTDFTAIGALVAIDADSGKEVWRVQTTGDQPGLCMGGAGVSVWSTAAIDPALGLAYVGTGESFEHPASTCNDSLLAIHYARDFAGERIAWKQTYTVDDVYSVSQNRGGPDADIGASPNLFEAAGRLLVGAGDKAGSYRVFDRKTGELIWRKDLEVGKPPLSSAVGGVMTTAAVSGDTLYVASNVFATTHWILDDTYDPADTGVLYALDTATGVERWKLSLPSPMIGGFAVANGLLYHPIVNGTLYARELTTGKEVWSTNLGASLGSGPSVVDGRLFISAGFVMNGAQALQGGLVASFGLADKASVIRDAPPDVLEPLDEQECKASLDRDLIPSEECGNCLCQCDATAAGHCDSCFSLAPCIVSSCSSAQAPDTLRACMTEACGAKLTPSYDFNRAVDVGPCVQQCAASCGLR